jgi:hypothetical protein
VGISDKVDALRRKLPCYLSRHSAIFRASSRRSHRRWSRDVMLEQIQTWKTGFLRAKVRADPEIHAEKPSGCGWGFKDSPVNDTFATFSGLTACS